MTQYAVVVNNRIDNVIEAESLESAQALNIGTIIEVPINDGIAEFGIGYILVDGNWINNLDENGHPIKL